MPCQQSVFASDMWWKVLLLTVFLGTGSDATKAPIIGVLAQECSTDCKQPYTSFVPAGYVKAVEASGARAAPVFIRRNETYYRDILSKINGVVFPGGETIFSAPDGYGMGAKIIYNITMEMNARGDPFPILGICQGLEVLGYITNGYNTVLTPCKVSDVNLPLDFKPGAENSSLYKYVYPEDMYILANLPVTSNHHSWCLTEKSLKLFKLDTTWRVLSTSTSPYNDTFVSSMELSSGVPVAGVQFHPEKVTYEWAPDQDNPHGRRAVAAARVTYDWLVDQARASNHSFPTKEEEENSLIYNYCPVYTGKTGGYDVQDYFFIDPAEKSG